MTSHDEICQEVCDVGQQRGVHVKFLARLPCNARRHQANSLAWYKGRDCLRGKDQWCPAFCRLWLHGKQLPPSAKSQPFPHIGEILALSLLEGNKWHESICLFEVKQDLRVCSSSAQKWSCEFFWLNPRPCCGFQMSSWNCLCWDFQDYTLQLGFAVILHSALMYNVTVGISNRLLSLQLWAASGEDSSHSTSEQQSKWIDRAHKHTLIWHLCWRYKTHPSGWL